MTWLDWYYVSLLTVILFGYFELWFQALAWDGQYRAEAIVEVHNA